MSVTGAMVACTRPFGSNVGPRVGEQINREQVSALDRSGEGVDRMARDNANGSNSQCGRSIERCGRAGRRHRAKGDSLSLLKESGPACLTIGRSEFGSAGRWDRAGILRRARRIVDVSQRDMADRIGVSAATVARAELADGAVSVAVVEALLAQAGLRIIVVDESCTPVAPMRADAAQNHGRRRYAAHLDARIPTQADRPIGGWRRDRPQPRLTFNHRFWRDVRRDRMGIVPRDHTSEFELRLARHLRKRRAPTWLTKLRAARPAIEECRCGPACLTFCVPSCRCQCELGGGNPSGFD